MSARSPVTTLDELDALDGEEMVAGYLDGFNGDGEPGDNHSKAYWHGWRNGNGDRNRTTEEAQMVLVRAVVARTKRGEQT